MKRVFFLNRYFSPDHSATSQILSQLAFHLAETGTDVHVITSQQLYGDPQARLPPEENVCGVRVHRVSTTHFGRAALLGRGIDYLSFYTAAWRSLLTLADRGDIFVPMTDPPLLSIVAMRAARRRGAHLVNWLQDIYPEIAVELGVPLIKGPVNRLLSRLRYASLNAAAINVVVGECMAEQVLALGVSADHIRVVPNWSNDDQIAPIPPGDNPLRRSWNLEGKFVVGYSGNLGRAHEFSTVLAAAERLRDNPQIVFVVIGGGHHFEEFARDVKEQGLVGNFRFQPYQGEADLKYSLSLPDVHWISLRPELEGLIVPSKIYGIAAAGRPIIAITAKDGEIARLIQQYECGVIIEPGNAVGLARILVHLATDAEGTAAMGKRARSMLEAHFTRHHAFERWQRVLDHIG
jgi:colanic acid biosynthesis glycosyl transferase WcaI